MPKLCKRFVQSIISKDGFPLLRNIKAKLISKEIRLKSDGPDPSDEDFIATSHRTSYPTYRVVERI